VLIAGLALITAALVLFTQAPAGGGYASHILPVTILMGTGAGLAFPALMTVAMTGVTPADAGLASGLVNATAQVGGAIGLAVLATIAAETTGASQAASALLDGYHAAFTAAAAAMFGATALAFALTSSAVVLRVRDVLAPGRV